MSLPRPQSIKQHNVETQTPIKEFRCSYLAHKTRWYGEKKKKNITHQQNKAMGQRSIEGFQRLFHDY